MAAKDVKDIVREYLDANGFDGLYEEYGECACEREDLEPCCEMKSSCTPGYRVDYPERDCPCGEGCDYHIQGEKPDGANE
jgi:hypothetical protein